VVFVGLVHACRYCGLLDASVAAHEHAKRLDPAIRTSIAFTYLAAGDWAKALGVENNDIHTEVMSFAMQGRTEEAIAACKGRLARETLPVFQLYGQALLADLEGDRARSLRLMDRAEQAGTTFPDLEGGLVLGRLWARLGRTEEAILLVERSGQGYYCVRAYTHDPWLDPVRAQPAFQAVLRSVEARHREARAVFLAEDGDAILGVVTG
jgi:hypothetical protein